MSVRAGQTDDGDAPRSPRTRPDRQRAPVRHAATVAPVGPTVAVAPSAEIGALLARAYVRLLSNPLALSAPVTPSCALAVNVRRIPPERRAGAQR